MYFLFIIPALAIAFVGIISLCDDLSLNPFKSISAKPVQETDNTFVNADSVILVD